MRQLTEQEREALELVRENITDGLDASKYDKTLIRSACRVGFVAGLDYQQSKIDKLIAYIREEYKNLSDYQIEEIVK